VTVPEQRFRRTSFSGPMGGGPASPTTTRSRTCVAARTASPATWSTAASRPRASCSPMTAGSRPRTSRAPPRRSCSRTTSRSPSPARPCRPRCRASRWSSAGRRPASSSREPHNPYTDNGFKVKAPTGAAAGPEILAALEAVIATNGATGDPATTLCRRGGSGLVEIYDPYPATRRSCAGLSISMPCGLPTPASS